MRRGRLITSLMSFLLHAMYCCASVVTGGARTWSDPFVGDERYVVVFEDGRKLTTSNAGGVAAYLSTKQASESASVLSTPDSGIVIPMTKSDGTRYLCSIPEEEIEEGEEGAERVAHEAMMDVMESPSLHGHCFLRNEGWWTYELCVGKHVRQYHAEDSQVLNEFYLGKYNEELTMTALDEMPVREDSQGIKYTIQRYDLGTDCDISELSRSTEVRMSCSAESQSTWIASISEPATCQYVLHLRSAALCKHRDLKIASDKSIYIKCIPQDVSVTPEKVSSHEQHDVNEKVLPPLHEDL